VSTEQTASPATERPPRLSVCLLDADTGDVLAAVEPDVVRPTASVGKVLLLIEVARLIADNRLDPATTATRLPADAVADSGIWQHLQQQSLSVLDLAVLVGAVSDNLATNVLLRLSGVQEIKAVAERLDLEVTRLNDRVRDVRGPEDPPTLSTGSAAELAGLFGRLHRGEVFGPAVGTRVLDWLNLDTDTSMVAGAFGLDPLAHSAPDRGRWLAHKTGTDLGVRADVGLLCGPQRSVAYAVLAEFDDHLRGEVLADMRAWGFRIGDLAG
jgi:beta-lactamase class A